MKKNISRRYLSSYMERSHEAIKKCLTASGSNRKERGDTDAFWPKKGRTGGAESKANGNARYHTFRGMIDALQELSGNTEEMEVELEKSGL